ncbi:MAG: hypothetical protein IPJ71_12625 [Bdellovibrionales bacterium]|nr:hypothetical protein [Bdellovibrionales bacterium]
MSQTFTPLRWNVPNFVEASQAVVKYCFKTFEVNRMQARCKIENKGCSRVKYLGAIPDLDVYVYEPQGMAITKEDAEAVGADPQVDIDKISARQPEP